MGQLLEGILNRQKLDITTELPYIFKDPTTVEKVQ